MIIAFAAYSVLNGNTASLVPIKGHSVMHGGYFPLPASIGPDGQQGLTVKQSSTGRPPLMPSVPPKHMENSQFQEINTDYMNAIHSDTLYKNNTNVLPPAQISNVYTAQGAYQAPNTTNFAQLDCFPKDQLVSSDLLPKDGGFAESNPQGQGQLSNRNFFESGYHAGLNTQSNTLKNANQQLRSDPIIPRKDVGPWSQSTYDADTNRRPFEIGMA
jgi:hypothetical protein